VRALITGASGQLGSDLRRLIPDAVSRSHAALDITDLRAVRAAVKLSGCDLVFNCAAYNAVDKAEADSGLATAVNATGAGNLARACAEAGAALVQFSTNFVFDGSAADAYTEADRPNPVNVYGRSKLQGEQQVLKWLPQALFIRSSGLFGSSGSAIKGGSFPERILAKARLGESIAVVNDQFLNPTFTGDLAEAAVQLAQAEATGLFHVVADGCCSFHELAVETLRLAGVEAPVRAIGSSDLKPAAPRPANGCLASVRVRPLRPWRQGLQDYLDLATS